MKTQLYGKDMITTQDWDKNELETVLEVAMDLKKKMALGQVTPYLAYKTLYLLFFFSSTRTRASFEAAMDQLGGVPHDMVPGQLQLDHGDTAKEIGKILASYGHGIAIRQCDWGFGSNYIEQVAKHSSVPVFNMQCDVYHPFQALADWMTIIEKKGSVKGKKIVMSWAYAKSYSKPLSVPQSFLLLLSKMGADLTLAHPKEFKLMPKVLKTVKSNAKLSGGSLTTTNSMISAFKNADVVYPKSWGPLVVASDEKECLKISAKYKDWICDQERMKLAKKDAIYMHCLPADRGVEVSNQVIDGEQSVVYDQAENRLHVQKAVLALTMGGK